MEDNRRGKKRSSQPVRKRSAVNARKQETEKYTQRNDNTARARGKRRPLTPKQLAKKRRRKIVLFVTEVLILLFLLITYWGASQIKKIDKITINEEDIEINEQVKDSVESGAMKGYMNIALFGVDSRDQELEKNTRTDTMIIASINMDTKEIKMVSVYRDTYLNLSTDTYHKANAAYARGGAKQAISMLNMNLDLNITDFVTVGFEGLIDVVDAVGGIDVYVSEEEMVHLNSYQISIVGHETGTLNAAGEPNYYAEPYVEYTPVEGEAGVKHLNGLQATAYCRIRYIGNDFGRTSRQRLVLSEVAKKAVTLNPSKLSKIAEAVFPKISTSLDMSEIIELLGGAAGYTVVESSGFPFDGMFKSGRIGSKGSCIVPTSLEDNVIKLHEFFFDETWECSDTVKECSNRIYSDTVQYIGN